MHICLVPLALQLSLVTALCLHICAGATQRFGFVQFDHIRTPPPLCSGGIWGLHSQGGDAGLHEGMRDGLGLSRSSHCKVLTDRHSSLELGEAITAQDGDHGGTLDLVESVDGERQPVPTQLFDGFFTMFERFDTAFSIFDVDGDGTITAREIIQVLQSLGQEAPSDTELCTMFDQFDDNGNGTIDFDEFCMLMSNRCMTGEPGVDSMMRDAAHSVLSEDYIVPATDADGTLVHEQH